MMMIYFCMVMFMMGTYAHDIDTYKKFFWSFLEALIWPVHAIKLLIECIRK